MNDPAPNTNNAARALHYSAGNPYVKLRPVVAVDLVREGDGSFQTALWLQEGWRNPQVSVTPQETIAQFVTGKYRGFEMLIHNADSAMRFFLPALEQMVQAVYEITFTVDGEGRIIFAKITLHKNAWYIRDTFSLMPVVIGELRDLAGRGGDAPDVEVLLYSYHAFVNIMRDTFGIRPGVTIGATAMKAFLTTLPEGHVHYRQRPDVERLAREAYFGGLTFVRTMQEVTGVTKIDVNAMYAHAMRQGVPTRSGCYTTQKHDGAKGIYNCLVDCPPTVPFAFIPVRDEAGKVSYPRGTFGAVVTSDTLELAREIGYEIQVIDGYYFDQTEPIFDPFIDKCQTLENDFRGKGARAPIKMLRNSLAGKFGQRPQGKEYILTSDPTEDMTDVVTWAGLYVENLYYQDVTIERSYMMPVWAAWITSTARNTLVRAIYSLGPQNCVYGDTDSIVVRDTALLEADPEVFAIGSQYGEWKVEAQYTRFRALGRKFYIGYTIKGGVVTCDLRHAGIPREAFTADEMERLLPGGPPVNIRPYQTNRKALNTAGGQPLYDLAVKQIQLAPDVYADGQKWNLWQE